MSDNQENQDARRGGQPGETDRLGRLASERYVERVAENAADRTVDYATGEEDPQQRIDEAKEQARGLWAKYCGCLGSV
ncbi:hypothetical protein V5O48_007876 [Marasmius crinis-equi]|uniref:Uncharacterized protein n=1 Tax=Marasmius crinis-equi TaxID=585013 RepID=A0ABR3FFE7_9AGAR